MHLGSHLNTVKPGWKIGWWNPIALILWLRLVSPLPVCPFILVAVRLCPNSAIPGNGGTCLDIACVSVHSWSGQPHDTFHIHLLLEAVLLLRGSEGLNATTVVLCRSEWLLCMWIWVWTWHEHSHLHLCLAQLHESSLHLPVWTHCSVATIARVSILLQYLCQKLK